MIDCHYQNCYLLSRHNDMLLCCTIFQNSLAQFVCRLVSLQQCKKKKNQNSLAVEWSSVQIVNIEMVSIYDVFKVLRPKRQRASERFDHLPIRLRSSAKRVGGVKLFARLNEDLLDGWVMRHIYARA